MRILKLFLYSFNIHARIFTCLAYASISLTTKINAVLFKNFSGVKIFSYNFSNGLFVIFFSESNANIPPLRTFLNVFPLKCVSVHSLQLVKHCLRIMVVVDYKIFSRFQGFKSIKNYLML